MGERPIARHRPLAASNSTASYQTYDISLDLCSSREGSFQQYVVCVERYMVAIPDGVSDYVAGPIMCSASTVYLSLRESGLKSGQWAVFPGEFLWHVINDILMR